MHFFRPHAMMPRKRSVLREEASGALKTLKRLKHTNPSVRIDKMDDYQAIYPRTPDVPVTAGMLYLTLRSWQSVYPMCITEMFFIATGPQIQTRMNLHGLNRNLYPEINPRVSPLLCALFDRRISHCCLACVCPW